MKSSLLHANLIAFQTIVLKEIRRFLRIWVQTVLPAVITTSLYFIIFGSLIGSRIGTMDGYTYMDYIVPGIVLMAVISNSYANVVSSFFSAKMQKHVEELLVSPISNITILLGYVAGGVMRGITVGLAVSVVALFFSDVTIERPLLALLVIVVTAFLFSVAGFINAIFAKSFDDISIIPTFVLTPLTYLGGIFYTIKLLPEFWQSASLFNPILYMINAFRYAILGQSDIPIGNALGLILLFTLLLFGFAALLLHRGTGLRT